MTEPFNLDYVINFYKPKKEPCPVFTIKILVAKMFGCYKAVN